MSVPNVIALKRVSKHYGSGPQGVAALRAIDLTVPEGQFLSVMGASGSGKSTLLNVIAGLDSPNSGEVVVLGRDLAELSDDERSDLRLEHIGFVFQSFNLFPTLTVQENVGWPLKFRGLRWKDAARQAAAILQQVGIDSDAHGRRPSELSGGEQQRIAIARALIAKPALLLADEPTGNLDSRTGQAVLDLLRSLNQERKLTVVLVTHSAFAATYGHRTIEIQDGSIVRDVQAPRERGRVVPLGA
jgi:putative ABC transport system ATP-binding protein